MSSYTLSTYAAAGYTVTVNLLTITSTGGVGGAGVNAAAYAGIFNHGKINAAADVSGAIFFQKGGLVENFANGTITGGSGVVISAVGQVTNYGTITAIYGNSIEFEEAGSVLNGSYQHRNALLYGEVIFEGAGTLTNRGTIAGEADLLAGGFVVNGAAGLKSASIEDGVYVRGGVGSVTNFGAISGSGVGGVALTLGGVVTNGGLTDTTASIAGAYGVAAYGATAATVTNFGAISGSASRSGGAGVRMQGGGVVTNGAATDRTALIVGYAGVNVQASVATVSNFGTIEGQGVSSTQGGVLLAGGGVVTNGAMTDRTALILGGSGIDAQATAAAITNYGTIEGQGVLATQCGVLFADGGAVANGGGVDRTALIEGASGVQIAAGYGTIKNLGTIAGEGGSGSFGAVLGAQGYITNGSRNNAAALIQGYAGLALNGGADTAPEATNWGVISGLGDSSGGDGVIMGSGGAFMFNEAGGLIEGYNGVFAGAYAEVENFGTIRGAVYAIDFSGSNDTLIVEAGSAFQGVVRGGAGTLDLATGVGALSNFGGGSVTVSGSMAATTFGDFNTVETAAGTTFTDTGAVTTAAGQQILGGGTLTLGGAGTASIVNAGLIGVSGTGIVTLAGALKNTGTLTTSGGTLTVTGAVTGTGGISRIDGGTLDLGSSFTQNVTFTGTTGVLELAQSQGYTGSITSFSKTGKTSLDLLDITFVTGTTTATYTGNTTSGVLTVTNGTLTAHINLKGNYTTSTFTTSGDGHGGTTVIDPKAPALTPPHQFIAAAAGLGGSAGNSIRAGNAWAVHTPILARPGPAAA